MYFRGPWCNWSMVPAEARVLWWNSFKTKFSWDLSIAKTVKKGWESKCKRRLSGMISTMCTKRDYVAPWCAQSIRSKIMEHRATDKFKKRSEQCSMNKNNPEKDMPLHCQGSKSTVQLRTEMEKTLKCKVTPAEVYHKGHVNKEQKFVDKTAETVWANFESKKADNLELEAENQQPENDLFLEALGGWRSGRVYGLGSAADMFYERPHKVHDVQKARTSHVNQLESQIEQLTSENMELKKELAETKEGLTTTTEKLEQTNENVKGLQKQFQLFMSGRYNVSNDVGLSS